MAAIDLIYCAVGAPRMAEIAIAAGFRYGLRLPDTAYYPIYFADQNWRKPDREAYMSALAEHRPALATVLDWEHPEQLPEVLEWAEEAARYVETVIIIPKVQGGIKLLPRSIGGKPVRLGYSVPTRFAGTSLPLWEFTGWPVHLLGGSPHKQMEMARYLDVRSADGNYVHKLAVQLNRYWVPGNGRFGHRWQEALSDTGYIDNDAPYRAFCHSCENIMTAWKQFR